MQLYLKFSNMYVHSQDTCPDDYSGINFSNSNILNSCYNDIVLNNSKFKGVYAKVSSFPRCIMIDCTFDNKSDFRNTNLQGAHLNKSKFNGANLSRSNVIDADFSNTDIADLLSEKLLGAFYDEGTIFPEVFDPKKSGMKKLEPNVDLSYYDLSRMHLRCNDFNDINANLENANFKRADLKETIFNNLNLKGAKFHDAYLREADFRWAKMQGAKLKGADLTGAKYIAGPNTIFPKGFDPKVHGMIEVKLKYAE